MANKQDLPNAMNPTEIYNKLCENSSMRLRDWAVFGVSGLTGDGLFDCMDWLSREVSKSPSSRSTTKAVQEVFDFKSEKPEDTNNNVTKDCSSKDMSKLSFLTSAIHTLGKMLLSK